MLLTDAYVANGSQAWRIPEYEKFPEIKPNYIANYKSDEPWKPYRRDLETLVRYWAVPGQEGYQHRLGGLEKDSKTGAISTNPDNRQAKIDNIAKVIPPLEVEGDVDDADLLIVGWGGTYGHLHEAMDKMRKEGKKVAHAHFTFISPLPINTTEVLLKYKKVVIAEQNSGQLAMYLRGKIADFTPLQLNRIKGQPFNVGRLVEEFSKMMEA